MKLKSLLWVLALVSLVRFSVFSDVVFTDEQYEELRQTLEQLQQEQEAQQAYTNSLEMDVSNLQQRSDSLQQKSDNLQKIADDLKKVNQEQQNSYKKQKAYWIAGTILLVVSSSVVSYEIGKSR